MTSRTSAIPYRYAGGIVNKRICDKCYLTGEKGLAIAVNSSDDEEYREIRCTRQYIQRHYGFVLRALDPMLALCRLVRRLH